MDWLSLSSRHHLQLGGNLHSSHQQRLESHFVHLDHQLFQRAGGSLTLSLAEKTHLKKRQQKRHLFHDVHGGAPRSHLSATSLPPAGIIEPHGSSLCLRETRTFMALCKLHVVNLLLVKYSCSCITYNEHVSTGTINEAVSWWSKMLYLNSRLYFPFHVFTWKAPCHSLSCFKSLKLVDTRCQQTLRNMITSTSTDSLGRIIMWPNILILSSFII